jgi:2-hydroxy-6-oxonona-2,4-dienedioate hydrolase
MTTEQSNSHFVQTKAGRVHYEEAGQGHPVVLMHGSGPGATGSSNFAPNIGPLAERFRVIAPDAPGWGQSDPVGPDADRDAVGALLSFFDEIGIERAALVGNSMGGMTTLRFAVEHPDRVSHVVTMGAPSPIRPTALSPAGMSEGMKVLLETYADPTAANFKRLVQIMCFDPAFATDELAEARAAAAQQRPEHLQNFLGGFRSPSGGGIAPPFFSLGGRVAEISAPAMIVHGRDDRTVPMEHSLNLVAMIPNARLIVFNRCGHWAQIEHAATFNAYVTQFVEG